MKVSTVASSALLARAVSAQTNFTNAGIGAAQEGLENPTSVANKQVSFPFGSSQWTWSTDVQTFGAPDSSVPNAQIVNNEYSLGWTGSGSLEEAVAAAQGLVPENFCVTVVESLFPWRVLKHYSADDEQDASLSCEDPLTPDCYEKIVERWTETEPDENGCRGTQLDLGDIRQCEWTFETQYRRNTFNLLRNETYANATSGSPVAHLGSGIYDGSNATWVEQQTGRLQMVLLDSGEIFQPLCMRVDADAQVSQGASNDATTGSGANFWLMGAAALGALSYVL